MKNHQKAFTIIEVIVALTVLTIGVLGVQSFFATSSRLTTAANHMSTASNLAQGLLDSQIALSYTELIPSIGDKVPVSTDPNGPFNKYLKQINISLIDRDLNSSVTDVGLKKINVIVYYPESGSEKNVELSTIVTEK